MTNKTLILLIVSFFSFYSFSQTDSIPSVLSIDTLSTHNCSLSWRTKNNKTVYYIDNHKISKKQYDTYLSRIVDPMKCTPCYLKTYENNKLIHEGDFYTDCGVGNYIEYYPNGNVRVKGQYKRNLKNDWNLSKSNEWCAIKDGVWEYYDEKGNLIKSEEYQYGILKE